MSNELDIVELEVGIFMRRKLINLLKEAQFRGLQISWHEGRGFLSREFFIKGPQRELNYLMHSFELKGFFDD